MYGRDIGVSVAEANIAADEVRVGLRLKDEYFGNESKPEIPAQLDMVNQNLNELLEVITVLENRINPVMHHKRKEEKDKDNKTGDIIGGTTGVGSQLYACNEKLVTAIRELVSMMDRIEL